MVIQRIKILISGVLLATVITAGVPIETLHASGSDDVHIENLEKTDVPDDSSAEEDGIFAENVNFAYVESPYLETPGVQRIVLSFDHEMADAQKIELTVADSAGIQENWPLAKQEGNVYLFEKKYAPQTDADTYNAVSINIYGCNSEKTIELKKINVDIRFGINEKYDGIDELRPIETSEQNTDVQSSVVVADRENIGELQGNIADAITYAEIQQKGERGSVYSKDERIADGIVIALDPGHDSNDAGAQGFGLKEEELTLKIADYCREELEKYKGVTVYMTRTTKKCPYNCKNSAECIQKRVDAAKKAGADIYVSFHLNSFESSSAKGAEVIVPNENWKPGIGKEGEGLAEEILEQLVKLGLSERRIYSKDSMSGEKYADGSAADYFAVPRMCKQAGFPGIIIEHAFISNRSDVDNFLKTESGLKKLGLADANGIIQYYNLQESKWEKPSLQLPAATSQGINISWNAVKGATGYAVYRRMSGGDWKMVALTGTTAYTDKAALTDGRTYYYTVRAYRGGKDEALAHKYESKYWTGFNSSGVKAVYLKKPVISNTTAADSGIRLSWKASAAADGYAVYRKTAGTGWKIIGMTDSSSYTDKNDLKNGTEYYYTLRAYVGKRGDAEKNKYNAGYWSGYDYTGTKGFYTAAPVMDTVVRTASGTRVTWKNVSGVSGYAVYRKTAEGSWKMTGTTISAGYTDKNTGSTEYYYTVRAFRDSLNTANANRYSSVYWSGYDSNGMKRSDLETPQLTGAKVVNSGLQVSWKAVKGADGYAVYRKTEASGWAMTGMTTSNTYLDIGAASDGTVHYYTVRAYKGNKNTALQNKYRSTYWSYFDTDGVSGSIYKIEGKSDITIKKMTEYYYRYSPISYPAKELKKGGAATVEDLAKIFYEEASDEGIKPEVVWCQTMLETNYLKFGGDVSISQYNFAGIGATGGGAAGASFSDIREGVRAQIQHMKAYASDTVTADSLKHSLVDPRFHYVVKGSAKYVEILGARENPLGTGWASGAGYGNKITRLIKNMKGL